MLQHFQKYPFWRALSKIFNFSDRECCLHVETNANRIKNTFFQKTSKCVDQALASLISRATLMSTPSSPLGKAPFIKRHLNLSSIFKNIYSREHFRKSSILVAKNAVYVWTQMEIGQKDTFSKTSKRVDQALILTEIFRSTPFSPLGKALFMKGSTFTCT